MVGVSLSLISPFYPTEALSKGVSVTQTGMVMGSVFVTVIVSTPVCGKYIHIFGAGICLIIGSCIIGLGNFIFGFLSKVEDSNSFFALSVVIRIIIAVGDSSAAPAAFTLAAIQMSKEHRGKAIAGVETSFAIGTMFGPTIGGCLFDSGGFPLPFYVTGGLMMLLSVMTSLFFRNKTADDSPTKNEKSLS